MKCVELAPTAPHRNVTASIWLLHVSVVQFVLAICRDRGRRVSLRRFVPHFVSRAIVIVLEVVKYQCVLFASADRVREVASEHSRFRPRGGRRTRVSWHIDGIKMKFGKNFGLVCESRNRSEVIVCFRDSPFLDLDPDSKKLTETSHLVGTYTCIFTRHKTTHFHHRQSNNQEWKQGMK